MVWLLVITLKQILNKKRASRCLSYFSSDVKRYNAQDNFEKKEFTGATASKGESRTIMVGNMAAGRHCARAVTESLHPYAQAGGGGGGAN